MLRSDRYMPTTIPMRPYNRVEVGTFGFMHNPDLIVVAAISAIGLLVSIGLAVICPHTNGLVDFIPQAF